MWKIKLIGPAVMALLVTGCLQDNLSDCDQGIELIFGYTHHNYEVDLFGSEVEQVSVFVFDESGHFLSKITDKVNHSVAGSYNMSLNPGPGTYTLLVLGGLLDAYLIGEPDRGEETGYSLKEGVTSLDDFRLLIQKEETGDVVQISPAVIPAELYYDKKTVEVVSGRKQTYPINLIKNTSLVRFCIVEKADEQTNRIVNRVTDSSFDIFLSGNNMMVDSENLIPPESPVYRHTHLHVSAPEGMLHQAEYRMMRLMKDHPVHVKITEDVTGTILLDEDLLGLLLENGTRYGNQADLDREDLFEIEVEIDRKSSSVAVRVNGWLINKIKPVL